MNQAETCQGHAKETVCLRANHSKHEATKATDGHMAVISRTYTLHPVLPLYILSLGVAPIRISKSVGHLAS